MDSTQSHEPRSPRFSRLLAGFLMIAFVIAAGFTAYLVYNAVRDTILSLSDPTPQAFSPNPEALSPTLTVRDIFDVAAPLQSIDGPEPEPWDGHHRVTILLIGVDFRNWMTGNGPPLADTLILLTVDPNTQTAGMLSIPRDLWVEIPGFGYHKVNQAYQFGVAKQVPGSGPGLTIETIENLLEVDIQFYAQIDFGAFERFIDEIGGVKVDITERIEIDLIGSGLATKKTLRPGVQVLPGDHALAYARARNTEGSDFDRAQRQQQILIAIRDRVISFEQLPTLIAKSPLLYQELSSGVSTNLSLQQAIQLAWLAQQIPNENIINRTIGPDQVTFGTSPDGLDILNPIPDEILMLRDQVYNAGNEVGSLTSENLSTLQLVELEAARVSVRNGTLTAGLAANTGELLISEGISVTEITNADQFYDTTALIDYSGNPYTIEYLIELMKISQHRVYHRYDPGSEVDIVILLGDDWARKNPLP